MWHWLLITCKLKPSNRLPTHNSLITQAHLPCSSVDRDGFGGSGKEASVYIFLAHSLLPSGFSPSTTITCPGNNEKFSTCDISMGTVFPVTLSIITDFALRRPLLSQHTRPTPTNWLCKRTVTGWEGVKLSCKICYFNQKPSPSYALKEPYWPQRTQMHKGMFHLSNVVRTEQCENSLSNSTFENWKRWLLF